MDAGRRIIRRYYVWLLVYAAAVGLYIWLTPANRVPAELAGTPADPRTFMSARQLTDSSVLSALRSALFFLSYPWEWGVYVVLLFSGAASGLERRLAARIRPRWLHFPAYAVIVAFVVFVANMPLRAASYALSRHYGITTQPLGGWLRDKSVAFGLNAVTIILASGAALWLIRRRGGRWWLRLWLLSVPFTLFLMYVQPVVIDPLYDKFGRLSDPVLESHILQLAEQAHVPADRVYEVHMSGKTNAINAYVNGIGPTLRIVLWDTALKKLSEDEILQIMAHEIGHYVMHHLEWSAMGAVGSSFVLLWAGSRLLAWALARWRHAWGIERQGDTAVLPVLLLLVSVLTFVSLPLSNAVSRRAEHAADQYALKLIGSGRGAVTMNQKLAAATLDDMNPPLLVKWFRSNHPSDMERIRDAAAAGE